jgi:hypothetical protein
MNTNIYNKSGALTDLFEKLEEKSIYGFNSLEEIFDYKRNYRTKIEKIKQEKRQEIHEDISELGNINENLLNEYNKCKEEQILLISARIEQLTNLINNSKNNIFIKIKKHFAKKKLNNLERNYDKIIERPLEKYLKNIDENKNRIDDLTNNQENEIEKRAKQLITKIEYTITELNALSPLMYGSFGEIKAINLFQTLPNQYYVINDFKESFRPPLYNRNENDYIYSVQLDHIVIGPTGVYLIETKYWSKKSIENNDLLSPIKQIRRGGYALFILLNDYIKETKLFSSNWGTTKLSISNILLMMNSSTNEQFQFVKILTENNFIEYVTQRPKILNEEQIKYLVKYLR